MAETREESVAEMKSQNEDVMNGHRERLYSYMKELSGLVVHARLQANEANIRAKYALEFAKRAVAEAQSAHQVSGALAKTSRMVAALALEFTQNFDECIDSLSDSRLEDATKSFLEGDLSLQSAGDSSFLSEGWSFETISSPDVTDKCQTSKLVTASSPDVVLSEHETQTSFKFNDDQQADGLTVESSRPTTSDENTTGADDKTNKADDKTSALEDLAEEMKALEIKRKMRIYRDSKLVGMKDSADSRPAEIQFSEEGRVQTLSKTPADEMVVV